MKVEVKPVAYRRMLRSIRLVYGKASPETRQRIGERILDEVNALAQRIGVSQLEPALDHLRMGHRRVVVGKFKIIYRVLKDRIIVTDIFDARQDPKRMKG